MLDLSYSGLAEPIAAATLAGILWAWYAGRRDVAVLLSGLLPLARIETAVLMLIVLAAAARSVSWKVLLAAFVPVALWNLGGWITTGNLLYVLSGAHSKPLNSLGVWNYLRNGIVILGPVVAFFVVWGAVMRVGERSAGNRFPLLAAVLAGTHWVLLTLLAWDAISIGRSIGFLRHVVATAPALALVATWGVGTWAAGGGSRLLRIGTAVGWTGLVAWSLSHTLIAHSLVGEGRVETRWVVTAVLGLLGVLWSVRPRSLPAPVIAGGSWSPSPCSRCASRRPMS